MNSDTDSMFGKKQTKFVFGNKPFSTGPTTGFNGGGGGFGQTPNNTMNTTTSFTSGNMMTDSNRSNGEYSGAWMVQVQDDLAMIKTQLQSLGEMMENLKEQLRGRDRDVEMIHEDISCNGCGQKPIIGTRYKCMTCEDHDFCSNCERVYNLPACQIRHDASHFFVKIRDSTILNLHMAAQQAQTTSK